MKFYEDMSHTRIHPCLTYSMNELFDARIGFMTASSVPFPFCLREMRKENEETFDDGP